MPHNSKQRAKKRNMQTFPKFFEPKNIAPNAPQQKYDPAFLKGKDDKQQPQTVASSAASAAAEAPQQKTTPAPAVKLMQVSGLELQKLHLNPSSGFKLDNYWTQAV